MKPLKAFPFQEEKITYPCIVQPKLNGIRALYQNGVFQSGDEILFPSNLLAHLAEELKNIDPAIILDGELYVHGWTLQRINAAVNPNRRTISADTLEVGYHVFDIANSDLSQAKRIKLLKSLNLNTASFVKICAVVTCVCNTATEANNFYLQSVQEGYEGIMYRINECPYTTPNQKIWQHVLAPGRARYISDRNNRSHFMFKRKSWQDDDYVCRGFELTYGEKGEVGFILYCTTKNKKIFKISSGLTRKEVFDYAENPPINKIVKVKYLTLSEDGIPQNATILCIS